MKRSSILTTLLSISLISCSPAIPKAVAPGVPVDKTYREGEGGDSTIEFTAPKVDILFVIDDSGSMSTHQQSLANNVGRFVQQFFQGIQIDFHSVLP